MRPDEGPKAAPTPARELSASTTKGAAPNAIETLALPSAHAWERWLEQHHAASQGVWLKLAKKNAREPGPSYSEALDLALCFGWIDGQRRALDAEHFVQRFTPRRPSSVWSKINRAHVERLTREGRMRPSGLAEVQRAEHDGRMRAAYDGQRTATVPDDLTAALAAEPAAAALFARLDSRNRYAILHRLMTAARAETRARRIETFVAMLARGETLYPLSQTATRTPATRERTTTRAPRSR